jgi:hypothetical protein
MIRTVAAFRDYLDGIRRRTLNYVRVLPPDRLDWAPAPGEFTCGDILRRLAAAEQMFVGAVVRQRWHSPGHTGSAADTLESLVARLAEGHAAALTSLGTLSDAALDEERPTLNGTSSLRQ